MFFNARFFVPFALLCVGAVALYQGAVTLKIRRLELPLGSGSVLEGTAAVLAGWLLVAVGVAAWVWFAAHLVA